MNLSLIMLADKTFLARKVEVHHRMEALIFVLYHSRWRRDFPHCDKLQLLHNLREAVRIL
jgi:hypothetical protein